jgi:hypothetical protein
MMVLLPVPAAAVPVLAAPDALLAVAKKVVKFIEFILLNRCGICRNFCPTPPIPVHYT